MLCYAKFLRISKEVIIIINSLLSNTSSIKIQNNLNKNTNNLSISLERMASGLKINRAKDDAAGYVISSKTNVQLSGLNIANKNAMQGISMLNIADDSLKNMSDKTMRIRDLALEAMNSTYSNEELNAIQDEIDELIAEIKREKDTTIYNQKKIFEPSQTITEEIKPPEKPYAYEVEYIEATGTQYLDTGYSCDQLDTYSYTMQGDFRGNSNKWSGANAYLQLKFSNNTITTGTGAAGTLTGNDTITCDYRNITQTLTLNGTEISSRSWDSYNKSNVKIGIFRLGDANDNWYNTTGPIKGKLYSFKLYKDDVLVGDYIPVVDNNKEACLYDKVTGQFLYNQGSGSFKTGDPIPAEESEFITSTIDNSTTLQIGQDAGENNAITFDLGFDLDLFSANITSSNDARRTLQKCDELINTINSKRSQIGSNLNRIDSICRLQNNQIENLSKTKSLITDTDIAAESVNLIKTQINKDISNSLFMQSIQLSKNLTQMLLIK